MGEDISLWGNLDEVAPLSREEQEATVSEGKIIDIITGDKPIKDTPKEQVRQFIAKALHEQYNIDYEDMQADFSVPTEEKKRRVIDRHHAESCVKTSSHQASTDAKPVPPLSRI